MLSGGTDLPADLREKLNNSQSPIIQNSEIGSNSTGITVSPQQTIMMPTATRPNVVSNTLPIRMRAHSVGGYHHHQMMRSTSRAKGLQISTQSQPGIVGVSAPSPLGWTSTTREDIAGSFPNSPVIPSHVIAPVPARRGSIDGKKELRKSRSVINSPYWGTSTNMPSNPASPKTAKSSSFAGRSRSGTTAGASGQNMSSPLSGKRLSGTWSASELNASELSNHGPDPMQSNRFSENVTESIEYFETGILQYM